jgi:hypothetical protein
MKIQKVHIGSLIKAEIKHRDMTFTEFAKRIGTQKQNVESKIFRQHGLNTDLLIQISEVLNFDFFKYFQNDTTYNHSQLQREVKTTLTIEMDDKKQDKEFRLVFSENDVKIVSNLSSG